MSFLEEVIRNAARIEERLASCGGNGSGIYELAKSVRPKLNENLFARIQSIAAVRNKFAHEPDYQFEGNEVEFLDSCESVLMELNTQPQSTKLKNIDASNNLHQEHMEGQMDRSNNNTWVYKPSEWNRGGVYYSTLEKRLVFYAGESVLVKPIGKHRAGLGFPLSFLEPITIEAIGLVKLLPDHVQIKSEGNIITSDGIPVEIEIVLTISVLDNEDAIKRVALDADAQQTLIINSALTALRSVICAYDYQNLMV